MWYILVNLMIASLVSAHGRVTNITTSDGTVYAGWDPEVAAAAPTPLSVAAWSASNLGNIFVSPSEFNTSAIACHYNATPGAIHVNTSAGDTLKMQWNEWPTSHVGPVLSYLAACDGPCTHASRETLKWAKIDDLGWLNSTGREILGLGGTWATDVLIKNGFRWTIKIPEVLAEGYYVLRHEIIALHVAETLNGAQAYPQCVNLRVAKGGSGQSRPLDRGILGARLYGSRDKGILVDLHKNITGYEIPGPKIWDGARRIQQPNVRR